MLGTINKAGQVLRLFTIEHPEWGLSEIARQLISPRSTVYELLASLVDIGQLSRTPQGRYRLGSHMVTFSHLFLRTSLVYQHSADILQELSDQYNESALISILDDLDVVVVNTISSLTSTTRYGSLNGRLPAHCTALGKVLLAECKWDEVKPVLEARGLKQFSPNTVTQFDRLRSELEDVHRRGWAESMGEMIAGTAAISGAVRNENGVVIAALGVCLPVQRYMDVREEVRAVVLNACARVSANLGYRDPAKTAKPTVM